MSLILQLSDIMNKSFFFIALALAVSLKFAETKDMKARFNRKSAG